MDKTKQKRLYKRFGSSDPQTVVDRIVADYPNAKEYGTYGNGSSAVGWQWSEYDYVVIEIFNCSTYYITISDICHDVSHKFKSYRKIVKQYDY